MEDRQTISVPEAGKHYYGLSTTEVTQQRAEAKFRQSRWGACFGCRCGPWSGCSTRWSGARMPLESTQAQSGAGFGPSRYVAGAMAGRPPVRHDEPHAG